VSLTRFSIRCIQVIAGVLGRAGEAGQKQRLEAADKGEIIYPNANLQLPETEEGSSPIPLETPVEAIKASPVEEGKEDTDKLAARLDEEHDHDGRRHGHRIKVSA
jgi:small subunit ribosomal protein S2